MDDEIAVTLVLAFFTLLVGLFLGMILGSHFDDTSKAFQSVCIVQGGHPYPTNTGKEVCIKGGVVIPAPTK
jgi:hypothetical protein